MDKRTWDTWSDKERKARFDQNREEWFAEREKEWDAKKKEVEKRFAEWRDPIPERALAFIKKFKWPAQSPYRDPESNYQWALFYAVRRFASFWDPNLIGAGSKGRLVLPRHRRSQPIDDEDGVHLALLGMSDKADAEFITGILKSGDPDRERVLIEEVDSRLKAGEVLSGSVRLFHTMDSTGRLTPAPNPVGRKSLDADRNKVIILVMAEIYERYGRKPARENLREFWPDDVTRESLVGLPRTGEDMSVCKVMAEALRCYGIGLSAGSVKGVWDTRKKEDG